MFTLKNSFSDIETNFWNEKGHQKDVFPVEYPPEEIAKTEKYTLEEPLVTLTQVIRTPITVQELEKVSVSLSFNYSHRQRQVFKHF